MQSRDVLLSSVLELAPRDPVVRAAALVTAKPRLAGGGPPPAALGEPTPAESLVIAAWRTAAAGDWDGVEAMDGELAAIGTSSPLYWEAVLARAQWRARSPREAEALESLTYLDAYLSHQPDGEALLLYAFVAERWDLPAGALAALSDLSRMAAAQRSPAIDGAARRLLRSSRYPPSSERWIAQIARRLDEP
jgi:hypothetical protein